MESIGAWADSIRANVEKVIYGKTDIIEKLLISLLCKGHVLLEDVPGVGKTILARALSQSLGGAFRRIQCTPDLLPADILGVSIYNPKTSTFDFKEGPIVTNILLVDEINRATPRSQSALLEAMTESSISVEGRAVPLPSPFFMIATENPVEFEGTFLLPEAQKDRFFLTLRMGYPSTEAEDEIMLAQERLTHPVTDLKPVADLPLLLEMQERILSVTVDDQVVQYILDLVNETRKDSRLHLGASPRASMALYKGAQAMAAIRGRQEATAADVRELVLPVFLKRISVKSEHLLRGLTEEKIIAEIREKVAAPDAKTAA
jgi:MoxR-like ATPase